MPRRIDPEYRAAFERALSRKNVQSLRYLSILAALFVPFFLVLDYFVAPGYLREFLYMRIYISLFSLGILVLSATKLAERRQEILGVCLVLTIGVGIALMVHFLGGYSSSYYAGINLVVLAAGVLFSWRLTTSLLTFTLIYLAYIVPILPQHIDNSAVFINNNFFLVTTIVVVVVAMYYNYYQLYNQVVLDEKLERSRLKIEEAFGELEKKDRYKTEFFSNITHELRTPLTLILVPIESILDGEAGRFTPDQVAKFQHVHRNALQLLKLINDLLDMTRLSESRMKLSVAPVDLRERIEGVIAQVAPLAARKELDVRFACNADPRDMVVDWDKLERALLNLLGNAIKFTPARGKVTVSLGERDGFGTIEVADTGIGIPPDALPHVFDRFFQADGGITRRYGGTGIGLALVQEIVKLHGGEIDVRSEPGGGSTFTVRLRRGRGHYPLDVLEEKEGAERPAPGAAGGADDADIGGWLAELTRTEKYKLVEIAELTERRLVDRAGDGSDKSHRILVVDDNLNMLRFLAFLLHEQFDIVVAQEGEKAIELAGRFAPDLVITDYMMPGMDGMELCRRLKANPATAHLPVVMLTAKGEVEDRIRGKDCGVDEYLTKPFSTRELFASVRKLLKLKEESEEVLIQEKISATKVFTAGLTHEVNNALNYIRNACAAIEAEWGRTRDAVGLECNARGAAGAAALGDIDARMASADEKISKMLGVCDRGFVRIQKVVDAIRLYSREGYAQLPRRHSVEDSIRAVVEVLFPPPDKKVNLTLDLRAPPAMTVECVPEHLNQVLTNLLQNAIDAVGEGGNVLVRTEAQDLKIVLSVKDDGEGIRREDRGRIFTPFFTTKPPGRGLGLGLAVSHHMVRNMGGTLEVESEAGKGSEFKVTLPASAAD